MIKVYYHLTKPGIIFGNIITAVGGFFLASKGDIDVELFLATLVGLSFVIASACVFNNYIDRGIDIKMARTKNRALVKHLISDRDAIIYAVGLGIIGVLVLFFLTNLLTVSIALLGFFFYVVVYGIGKRRSVYGTIIGSISGAVPPVVGYCAVSNSFDLGAIIIFIILVIWQMPHFYAIAMYRFDEYKAAHIPVLPIVGGLHRTKIQILLYIIAFLVAVGMLTIFHYTGYTYFVIVEGVGLIWLSMALQGFKKKDNKRWARTMYSFSLIMILVFSFMLCVGSVLP